MKYATTILALLFFVACGTSDGGEGDLLLEVSGEEAAEVGFPVPGNDDLAFVDGWELAFDKYLVGIGNVRVGPGGVADGESVVVDLTAGEQELFRYQSLEARRYEEFGYDILVPTADSRLIGAVSETDRQRMIDGGFNYWIEGRAKKDGKMHRFAWGLRNPTRNHSCVNAQDDTPGVVVRNNAEARYQITLHLDHLFYDKLGDHEGVALRFAAIAAVATERDGESWIEWDALSNQSIVDLRDADGQPLRDPDGGRVDYEPLTVRLDSADLRGFLNAAAKSQGRFHGEGACVNDDL